MIRYAASAGSPCRISCFPESKPIRSLMKANSFSFEGSISAKIGTRRSSSNSSFRLILFLPCPSRSFGGDQQRHQRPVAVELGRGALLLQLAIAENENAIEIFGEAGPVHHPNDASTRELVLQSLGHSRLPLPVECRGGLVENQEIGALEHLACYPRLLTLGKRQARSAGANTVIESDIDYGLAKR